MRALHALVRDAAAGLGGVLVEHLFIDNASTDGTQEVLRSLAAEDPSVRVIINLRNFGHVRSPITGCCRRAATPSS